ncbi:unnamed protein product [Urochloa decumbens]|uniref:BTB domain-containing protein n=1 Tax=Urochloa decumbens TaxID=240449 RepID=A0ABC9BZE2_9POAL
MAGDLTIKRTFEVPAIATSDGTLFLCPYFHRSPVFAAAGYDWFICYYPDSLYDHNGIDLCLHLNSSQGARVNMSSGVSLLDPTGSLPRLNLVVSSPPLRFDSDDADRRMVTHWVPKSMLTEEPAKMYYLRERGSLMFEWTITVLREMMAPMSIPMPIMSMLMPMPKLPAATDVTPPPKPPMPMPVPEPETLLMPIPEPMPKIPATDVAPTTPKVPVAIDPAPAPKVPAPDVTFSVGGELFQAHKAILSMMSPVFKAELSSSEAAATAVIEVNGMRPDVFEALMCYMYTSTLPAATTDEAMCDLLAAADRYDVEGLKVVCERKLSKMVDADNVADMLALADDVRSRMIEDACIQFMVNSGRMKDVVESRGYQRLRMKHPSVLVNVLEKYILFRTSLYKS